MTIRKSHPSSRARSVEVTYKTPALGVSFRTSKGYIARPFGTDLRRRKFLLRLTFRWWWSEKKVCSFKISKVPTGQGLAHFAAARVLGMKSFGISFADKCIWNCDVWFC